MLAAEVYAIATLLLGYFQTIRPLRRLPVPVPGDPQDWPAVDVYVPTYNEPLEVVRRTVFAALNMDWPQDKLNVWLLDDGDRDEFREFAEGAGAGYINRESNDHAKAGNINNALRCTNAEFVAIFDCDHIPTRSFLQMTIGSFLRDERLGMLQTPHHFYSPDPFERNLSRFHAIPSEDELFYGIVQDGNDFWNAAFFCGSCAVMRRSALDEIGGLAVETVTEDAHTSLRMQTRKWNTAYINIPQAAGLATTSLAGHIGQRTRWARGMIQVLRTENPITARGLTLAQRLCYLNSTLHFLYALPRLIFLTAPLIYLLFGISNFYGYWLAILCYALPHILLANITNARIQGKYRFSFWNEIYEAVLAPYILAPTLKALVNPRFGKFNVTSKGDLVRRTYFDRKTAWPFLVLLSLNLGGVGFAIARLSSAPNNSGALLINLVWALYNVVILGATTAVAWEAHQQRRSVRLQVAVPVAVRLASGKTITTSTANVSFAGLAIKAVPVRVKEGEAVRFSFDGPEGDCDFPGHVVRRTGSLLCIELDRLDTHQEEALTRILYSRADSWLSHSAGRGSDRPLYSFLHILGISLRGLLLIPKGLFAGGTPAQGTQPELVRSRRQAVLPLTLLACLLLPALAGRAHASARVANSGVADRAEFQDAYDLRSLGLKQPIVLRGLNSQSTIYFGVPATKVVTKASMSLRFAISNAVPGGDSKITVLINGTEAAALDLGSSVAGSAKLELPADLLTRDNALTFELNGAGVSWARIEMESELAMAGQMLPLSNDLRLAPTPFLDLSVQRVSRLPFLFSGKLENQTLAAAGVVASWFGVFADQRGVQFPVVAAVPAGNFVLLGTASTMPSGLQLTVAGPAIAIRNNPRDPYGKVLIVTGNTPNEVLIAARALVSRQLPAGVDLMNVAADGKFPELPAYTAPRWLSAEKEIAIGGYTSADQLQVSGSGAVNIYFRLPPDLYLEARNSVPLRLNYRYSGAGQLGVRLNGRFVTSLPLPISSDSSAVKHADVTLPVNALHPFRNTLTFEFSFDRGREHSGTILRDSELYLQNISHFSAMPRLELFSEAGFPFTRVADLAQTSVVMPNSPTASELELFLEMLGFFGAQTGAPSTLLTVVDAVHASSAQANDLIVIGSAEDQPLLSDWATELPVTIDQGELHVNAAGSLALWLRIPYLFRNMSRVSALRELLRSEIQADAVIQGLRSPLNASRSVVVLALRDRDHDSFSSMFLPANTAGPVYGMVSVAQNGSFHSFDLGESYTTGSLGVWNAVAFWLHTYLWIMPLLILLGAVLWSAWLHSWLEGKARAIRAHPFQAGNCDPSCAAAGALSLMPARADTRALVQRSVSIIFQEWLSMFTRRLPVLVCVLLVAVLALGSSSEDVLLSKARSLEGRGRPDLAAEAWQQILLADPAQAEALAGLARYYKQAGKPDQANIYLERLRKINPASPEIAEIEATTVITQAQQAKLREASKLAREQRFDEALRLFREVFGDQPPAGDWSIAFYETEAATPEGWAPAVEHLRELAQRFPNNQEYKLSLARLLTYHPETRSEGVRILEAIDTPQLLEKARKAWRQALVWDNGNAATIGSLKSYLKKYPADAELQRLRAARAANPPGLASRPEETKGFEYIRAGKLAEAEAQFEAVLHDAPHSAGALAGMGFVRMKQEDFASALNFFDASRRASPETARLVQQPMETARFWNAVKKATAALSDNRLDEAIKGYQEALHLRAGSTEAMQGLAGAYMKMGQPAAAAPIFRQLTEAQPQNPQVWRELINALHQSGDQAGALSIAKTLPALVSDKLKKDLDFLAALAAIYASTGEDGEVEATVRNAAQLAAAQGRSMPAETQVQFAGIFLRQGRAAYAANMYRHVTETHPENVQAWQGLITAYLQMPNPPKALAAMKRMPSAAYASAIRNPGFLNVLASLYASQGQLNSAGLFLAKSIELQTAASGGPDVATKLQSASLTLKRGDANKAESEIHQLLEQNPGNADVWKTYVSLLHDQGRDEQALSETQRMPLSVSKWLEADAGYSSILASMDSKLGQTQEAIRILHEVVWRFESQRQQAPVDIQVQLAWLLLDSDGSEKELAGLVSRLSSRSDVTDSQRAKVQELWSTWSVRRAQAAFEGGEQGRSIVILQTALRAMPQDARLLGALAGTYVRIGDMNRALTVYKSWRLKEAKAPDFQGAIGAALTLQNVSLAEQWAKEGLRQYPRDSQLLTLAGKIAAQKGQYQRAEAFWKEAMANAPAENRSAVIADTSRDIATSKSSSTAMRQLLSVLAPGEALPDDHDLASGGDNGSQLKRASLQGDAFDTRNSTQEVSAMFTPVVSTGKSSNSTAAMSDREQIQADIDALHERNVPFLGIGTVVGGRSGQGGYDQLIRQEANLEASTPIGDNMRFAITAKPVFLYSGAADGTSTWRSGSAPVGATFPSQSASGLGGEAQLIGRNFGLMAGSSPQGFLVHNFTGGFRLRPAGGPVTLLLSRDSVQDTMLSYAGMRDSASGQVWGGVMSNRIGVQFNKGDAASGFYAGTGYEFITGTNVADNKRMDGNVGVYWRVLSTPNGSLTVGANLFGMHYDKNLQYFTLGQGGYFSPQSYFLFSIPVTWQGTYNKKLVYKISGSLGSQHFSDDATPFFPTDASLQKIGNPYYAAQAVTGASYTLDAHLGYRLTPNWLLSGFLNANNTRNYSAQSAGVDAKYLFHQSQSSEAVMPLMNDWRGLDPTDAR